MADERSICPDFPYGTASNRFSSTKLSNMVIMENSISGLMTLIQRG